MKLNIFIAGDCGLVKQIVEGKMEVEIGYHINKKHWSQGFASEATKGCMEFGLYQLGLQADKYY